MNFKLDNQKRWWRTIIRNDLRDLFKLAGRRHLCGNFTAENEKSLFFSSTKSRISSWTVWSEKIAGLLILECEIKSTKSDPNQVERKIVECRGKRLRRSGCEGRFWSQRRLGRDAIIHLESEAILKMWHDILDVEQWWRDEQRLNEADLVEAILQCILT